LFLRVNGGLAALWKSVAEQGILDGIHVNLVQPGIVNTSRRQRLFEKLAAQEGIATPVYIDRAISQLRVTRLGEPDDVAELVAFLPCGRSRWMQGSIVDVDGGQNKAV
jgi:NAD(P)-dependent dehydrogenase (short-subunit alcohol dehydrogenase family)